MVSYAFNDVFYIKNTNYIIYRICINWKSGMTAFCNLFYQVFLRNICSNKVNICANCMWSYVNFLIISPGFSPGTSDYTTASEKSLFWRNIFLKKFSFNLNFNIKNTIICWGIKLNDIKKKKWTRKKKYSRKNLL